MLEKELNRKINIEMEHIDSFKCRFMGVVDTYDITLKDKNFKYTKAILHKPYMGSSILPIDKAGNVYLEIQYRFPIRQPLLELPAGRTEPNEDFFECAVRELREETGCVSENITEQTVIYGQPEFSDERLGSFLALNCEQTEKQHLDSDESVYIKKVAFEDAIELVKRNIITDERTIIALGICKCIQNVDFAGTKSSDDSFIEGIKKEISEQGKLLEEKDVSLDYMEVFELGVVKDHIVTVPGNKNSRRECFYVKAGTIVIPVSKLGKIGVEVRYLPTVEKNMVILPEKAEFDKNVELEEFGELVTLVGYADDRQYMFLAKDLEETDDYIWLSKEEIFDLIKERKIVDGRVLAALMKYFL